MGHRAVAVALAVALGLGPTLVASACSGDDGDATTTTAPTTAAPPPSAGLPAAEVLGADRNLEPFARLLEASGLTPALDGPDAAEVTFLVPSRAAFDAAADGFDLDETLADPDAAAAFVRRHAVAGRWDLTGLVNAGVVTALDGTELAVEVTPPESTTTGPGDSTTGAVPTGISVGGVEIVSGAIPTRSGTIFVVDAPLPPAEP